MRTLPAAYAAAAVLALVAVGTGCASPQQQHPARTLTSVASPTAPPAPASPSIPAGGIAGQVFTDPGLTVTGGSLYLRRSLSPAQQDPPRMELARVNAATGAIVATNTFSPGAIGAPLAAAGSLWLTGSFSGHAMLLRLDPRTLMVTGELQIAPVNSGAEESHIAYAGGSIWVDGSDELVRVSPATVAAELTIPLPRADSSDVGASTDGGTLIVSEADGGNGTIQRRDPVTGTLLASHPMQGVIAPMIGGVSAAGAWVSEPTGMLGYIERFSAASLTPQARTQVHGSNGLHADVWGGKLWVRDQAAGPALNYCADPATGRRLATLPLPDLGEDYLMAVTGGRIYYSVPASSSVPAGSGFAIRTVPVPAACG
jgi:hypothetical protein